MVTTIRSNGHAAEPIPDAAIVRATNLVPLIPPEHARAVTRQTVKQRAIDPVVPRTVAAGRKSAPVWPGVLGSHGWETLPRRTPNGMALHQLNLSRMQPHQVMEILSNVNADVGLALHNMILMSNSGYTIQAIGMDGEVDTEGQRIIDSLVARVNAHAGGLDGIIDLLHYSTWLHGAQAAEIVLTPGLRDVEDIYVVAPWTIEFRPGTPYPRPAQRRPIDGKLYDLNEATFWYLPWQPGVDDPYGRLPFASVLSVLHFDLQLMYDLQVAVHSNAWDRLDVTILEATIRESMPEQDRGNIEAEARWVEASVDAIREALGTLQPDDDFVHTDSTTVKPITTGNRATPGVVAIMKMLERRIIRALKQLPILMGSNEGTTETHGTIQFEIWVDGLRAVQSRTQDMLEGMFTLGLQVHGRQSRAVMTWEPIRTTDRQKDAQSEATEILNAVAKRDQGWITQDDASQEVTGSAAVADAPTLDVAPSAAFQDATGENTRATHRSASQTILDAQSVRTFEDMPEYRETERELEEIVSASFEDYADAFPADEIAAEALAEADDDNEVALAVLLVLVARWYDSPAGRRLADALIADLTVGSRAGYNRVGQAILDQLGIDGVFDLTNRRLIADMERHVASRVAGFDEASQRRLARLIRREVRRGSAVGNIADAIRGEFREMSETRAALIAQTEATDLVARAVEVTALRNGVTSWTWEAVIDAATCAACAGNNGETREIGEPFPSGHTRPTIHPRCRCGCSLVLSDAEMPTDPWLGA